MLFVKLDDLLDYTERERMKWLDRFRQHGDGILETSAGAHGDGRFSTIADLIRHIFSAEKRYVERLSNRPLTDPSAVSKSSIEALFQFGDESRKSLKEFVGSYPAELWDKPQEFKLMNSSLQITPRKIVIHVVLHEIRHWAQIATILRLQGVTGDFHDFLFSPVLGGQLRQNEGKR
jgi:uncharacterized damage-inducible protein DinB